MADSKPIEKIFAIAHFHYDVEWWKTDDGYDRDVAQILDKALELLESHAEFKYVIDQALALRPYWRAHPEKQDLIKRLVKEGRIELVGGTFCAPDENIPTGEAFARQFVYGKRFLEGEVGGKVVCAWEIDEFGHPSQAPQIFARAGMESFTFARGVQDWESPDEPVQFLWESPDGTRIPTFWFAAHYGGMMSLGNKAVDLYLYERELKSRLEYEGGRACTPYLMIPFGNDFMIPAEDWFDFVNQWNAKTGPKVEFSLPRDFFAAIRNADLPVKRGEMNPLLDGCYESREKVKKFCRLTQHRILDAEKLASCAVALGADWPAEALDTAWERILENDFHDIVCGTGIDPVYRNTLRRYEEALNNIEHVRQTSVERIAAKVDTKVAGTPVLSFNTLNWNRRDVARVPLSSLKDGGNGDWRVTGPDGRGVPCQKVGDDLIFIADVPAMGYAVYSVSRGAAGKAVRALKRHDLTVENEYCRLTLDEKTGGIESLFDKETGTQVLDTSRYQGNEMLVEEDAGNLWTIQKTGRVWRAKDYRVEITPIDDGPVRMGFEVRGGHKSMDRAQRVWLYSGLRRIEFETDVDFRGKDKRVKVMFEPALDGTAKHVFETPFHSDERADGHWCAQNWVDVSDGARGLAVINSGNPGHDSDGASIGMTLFRSVSFYSPAYFRFLLNRLPDFLEKAGKAVRYMMGKGLQLGEFSLYDYHGIMLREWAGEGGAPDRIGISVLDHLKPLLHPNRESAAWERGAHSFRYAALPHSGDWKQANLPRAGLEFNCPLVTAVVPASSGTLPRRHSFLSLKGGNNLILTALKKAESGNGFAARVYDAWGKPAAATLEWFRPIRKYRRTNLIEDADEKVQKAAEGQAGFAVGAWEIATVKFE